MKNKIIRFVIMCAMGGWVFSAKAANVVWPTVTLSLWNEPTSTYVIGSETTFGAGAGGWINLVYTGDVSASLTAENYTAGIGHIWFQTSSGSAINAAAVSSSDPFINAFTGQMGSIDIALNEVFYIAFYLDGSPYYDATYGWASFVWDGTTLTLLDSAYETTGVGIFAGTYDPVPEPSSGCLIATGLAALALRRRRRSA